MRWFVLPLLLLFAADVAAGESFNPKQFDAMVSPFVKKHCISCHNADDAEGGLDLSVFKSADDLLAQRKAWQRVVRQLKAGAMPPEGHPRPNEKQVKQVITWLEQVPKAESSAGWNSTPNPSVPSNWPSTKESVPPSRR
jgi:mono/diheme cytochrome c family protein